MTEDRSPKDSEESTAAATTTRQRKKRKWDQPAESLISAGVALPGVVQLSIGGISQLYQSSSISQQYISQNTAAIVQKLNQPKIQDELIAREIVINDAESTVRYKLTKRQTQEEIQKSTGAVVITRGKYHPPNGLPDSEKPLYLHISAGAHLKDTAERIKAVDCAASMVEEMLRQCQNSLAASIPFHSVSSNGQVIQPLSTCVFLGFDTDPLLNIAARIRGPNDQYINHIMNETGATVVLRGRGSGSSGSYQDDETQQPLHLYLSSTNQRSLEDARILAENLMDTICAECGATRISSCKVYGAVPPPIQLMGGVQSSAKVLDANVDSVAGLPVSTPAATSFAHSGAPVSTGSHNCPPGTVLQSGGLGSYVTPYSYPSVTGGTCYNGYGGIYPQATPLQQVALALRQAPALVPSALPSTTPSTSTLTKTSSISNVEMDKKPPQKRKFQELSVTSKGPAILNQNLRHEEFLKPGSDDPGVKNVPTKPLVKNVSTMPPPKNLVPPGTNGMPPPPSSSNMPPAPPPKFSASKSPPKSESGNPVVKPSAELVSDTLLKLTEYGEDDEIDSPGEAASLSNPTWSTTSKPFWAV